MKVVILCGGLGSRLGDETKKIPKPMIKIGPKPILEHIMEIYKKNGFNDFILATGYKHNIIKNYFEKNKKFKNIQIINTGEKSLTGRRLFRLKKILKNEKKFMLTYGDGLTNQKIKQLIKFHDRSGKIATLTAVRPPVRFGEIKLKNSKVIGFAEKPQATNGWINGGFFIFDKKIFNFFDNSNVMLETKPMMKLLKKNELSAYKHYGEWQCMDTVREKKLLNDLYKKNKHFWK
tara:strand:+ start:3105 stop:3803 length:699 start_codon:yes stop_codon:yes gene_type:complete